MASLHDELKQLRQENREDHKELLGKVDSHGNRITSLESKAKLIKWFTAIVLAGIAGCLARIL